MPTGDWRTIDFVLRHITPFAVLNRAIAKRRKLRMLDVGMGGGRWGFLFRDAMEWRCDRFQRGDWVYEVDGIEPHAAYRNPAWTFYGRIDNNTAIQVIPQIETREEYDFVLLMDVLEHMPKAEGLEVIDRLINRCRGLLFVSFPDGNLPKEALAQGVVHGNPLEQHISLWTVDELAKRYDVVERISNTTAVFRGRSVGAIKLADA